MRRFTTLLLCMGLCLSTPVFAQDRSQTLADIRQELSVLFVELQRLRRELNTTGGATGSGGSGSMLSRVDAIEAEMRRLTGLTEELELRINRVVTDGTNRVGDLEFRLCELEPDCDIGSLGDTPSLGGVEVASSAPAAPEPQSSGGASLAVAEQSDFDRARTAYDAGDFQNAATLFEQFTATYPGGPLSAEAHFLRGEALTQTGGTSQAARAYLDAFTADPTGALAPQVLVRLGTTLHDLGQSSEGCLTLAEVPRRFPNSASSAEAQAAMTRLNCS